MDKRRQQRIIKQFYKNHYLCIGNTQSFIQLDRKRYINNENFVSNFPNRTDEKNSSMSDFSLFF